MQNLNDHLVELVKDDTVEAREAYLKAVDKQNLLQMFEKGIDPIRRAGRVGPVPKLTHERDGNPQCLPGVDRRARSSQTALDSVGALGDTVGLLRGRGPSCPRGHARPAGTRGGPGVAPPECVGPRPPQASGPAPGRRPWVLRTRWGRPHDAGFRRDDDHPEPREATVLRGVPTGIREAPPKP